MRLRRRARTGRLAVCAAAFAIACTGAAGRIPPPPPGDRQPAAVRDHLDAAYAAAREAPRSPDAVGAYCVALHADMFYDAANRCYAIPIELAPDQWRWRYHRALLRSDLGDAEDLAAELRAVVMRAPDFAPAWLRLGDAEFKAGRHDDAEAAWRKTIGLPEPDRSTPAPVAYVTEIPAATYAWLGIARIRLLRGDRGGARDVLERLAADGPPFSSVYRLLGEILEAGGARADAALAMARARRLPAYAPYADPVVNRLALESRNSTFLIRLASEANLAVNGKWAEYLTRRALEFDPENPEVVLKLGRVLRTLDQNLEAVTLFRRYEAMVPGDPQVLAHMGSSLSALGRYAEAEPYLRRAATTLDDALSHYNLGLLLALTGRVDEAILEYGVALERDPNDVAVRGNLAAAYMRQGRADRAERELRRVLDVDPENALAHANLGLLYAQSGDIGRARRALTEALRLDPALAEAAEALRSLGGA